MNAISLSSGINGISMCGLICGFKTAGFDVLLDVNDVEYVLKTDILNCKNLKAHYANLANVAFEGEIKSLIVANEIDVIIGAPRMDWDSWRHNEEFRDREYTSFIELVNKIQPKSIVVTKCSPFCGGNFSEEIGNRIIDDFAAIGYSVQYRILCTADYGIPHSGFSIIFVGTKDSEFVFPKPNFYKVTCSMALSDLPAGIAPQDVVAEYPIEPQNEYQKIMRGNAKYVENHVAESMSEIEQQIISLIPDGGDCSALPKEHFDIATNETMLGTYFYPWERLNSKRLSPNNVFNGKPFFHYEHNRPLTIREYARLKSFPDNFIFDGIWEEQQRVVTEAFPPLLAEMIAQSIKATCLGR